MSCIDDSRHPDEPRWLPPKRFDWSRIPSTLRSSLLDESSLTQRLLAASGGDLRVRVLRQRWATPLLNERQRLGMAPRQAALVREVCLECRSQPWVFARSILPARTLTGALRHLRRFADKSLGEQLFRTQGIQRDEFEVCNISTACIFVPEPLQAGQVLVGRRSRFWFHGKPMLVCEIFLPGHRLDPYNLKIMSHHRNRA